jgi:hypothetical protein
MSVAPTAADRKWRAFAKAKIAAKGRSLVLRIPTRIEIQSGPDAGRVVESPLSTKNLLVDADTAAGAGTLSLRGEGVRGLLVAGDRLVFASHTQVYEVTDGPYVADGDALANVSISPPLVEDVAADEAVTVSFNGTDVPIKGLVVGAKWVMVDRQLTRIGDERFLVSNLALEEKGVNPTPDALQGQQLFLGDSDAARRATILDVEPIASGELDAASYLSVKAA